MKGGISNVWFDRLKISNDCPEHLESIDVMCQVLTDLIDDEVKTGIKKNRILVGKIFRCWQFKYFDSLFKFCTLNFTWNIIWEHFIYHMRPIHSFPDSAVVKQNLPAIAEDARDTGFIPGSGRFPEGGNGNPLQYSCLGNSMDRGAWRAIVGGLARVSMT